MTIDLDALITGCALPVPDDFSDRVMRQVQSLPSPASPGPAPRRREHLQWLALLAATGLGLSQVLTFIFGLWMTSAAL
ncbi:MAG: hypothetical protein RLZZ618_2894 [Pseudomonadota bacterium]|jgi:hypothetical protein